MPDMGYAAIRHDGDIRVFFRELSRVINGRTLRPSHRKGVLCDTNRAAPHTNSKGISAGINQRFALFGSNDVPTHYFKVWVCFFDVFDRIDLEGRITLG